MTTDQKVINGLNGLLADATVFYQKLRHYHWNVDGQHFFELHEKFEELYARWADSIDDVAERIRMVEGVPLHTLAGLLEAAKLQEDESTPTGREMVEAVVSDLKALHARAGEVVKMAEAAADRGTANLLDELRDAMEKDVWMFRSWQKEAAKTWS